MAAHTYVHYFVPLDGDSEDVPNAFLLKKDIKSIKLQDVQQAFPLPGSYMFRAKATFGKTHVWLDLNSPEDPIPVVNGRIVLKVARITAGAPGSSPAPVQSRAPVTASRAPSQSVAVPSTSPSTAAPPAPVSATAPAPAPAPAAAPHSGDPFSSAPAASARGETTADMLGLFASGPSGKASPLTDVFAAGSTGQASPVAARSAAPSAGVSAAFGGFPNPTAQAPGWGSPMPMGGAPRGVMPARGPAPAGQPIGGPRPGAIGGPAAAPSPAAAGKTSSNILDGDIFNM